MSVEAVIEGANTVLATLTGIKRVWANAPESLSELPATILTPEKGTVAWPRRPNLRDTTHDLRLTLLVNRGADLPSADQALKPWVDTVIALFDAHVTLGGSCLAAGVSDYTYGHVEYGGVPYLGITFNLKAREVSQVVFQG